MSRRDHWRERQRNPWPHTSREAKKQQKKSHFWYLIRIDPVEHIKNFGRGQIHIFQTWTNLQVYKQNTVSQRWETQARGSPWIKLDWETPTWTWSKETKSLNFYYLPSSDKEKRLKINKAKKETLTKRPQTKVKHHQGLTSVTSKHSWCPVSSRLCLPTGWRQLVLVYARGPTPTRRQTNKTSKAHA